LRRLHAMGLKEGVELSSEAVEVAKARPPPLGTGGKEPHQRDTTGARPEVNAALMDAV